MQLRAFGIGTLPNCSVLFSQPQHMPPIVRRVETERLQLQKEAADLAHNKQELTADVLKLQQQLAEAHAVFNDSVQQVSQLSTARSKLQAQV